MSSEPTLSVTLCAYDLGKYRLIAELGRGGMADVFLAVARGPVGFNKLQVVKRIREQLAEDPEMLAMFLDEARLAARLDHPNIVQTNEIVCEEGRYLLVMEYLEGQSLSRILQRVGRGSLPLGLHLRVLCETLVGLHYAHEFADYDGTRLGIVHRDISPHNILLTYSGQVKLVDFGVAKAITSSIQTRTGEVKGKVPYMAPEQARGEHVDRRADIFSAGVVLWEALAKRRLWQGVGDMGILRNILSGTDELPSPRAYCPDVPPQLEAVAMRALRRDRGERYPTAPAMRDDLEAAMAALHMRESTRDAGDFLIRVFAEERAQTRSLIEQQLAAIREAPPSGPYAVPVAAPSGPHSVSALRASSRAASAQAPSPDGGAEGPTPPDASAAGEASLSSKTLTSTSMGWQPASGGKRALIMGAAVCAVAAAAALAYKELNPPSPAEATAAAPHNASAPPPEPARPPQQRVEVRVIATPPQAQIFVDGRPSSGNPAVIVAPPDGKEHEIRAALANHETKTQTVTFDKSMTLELALSPAQPRPAAPRGWARPSRAAPTPPSRTSVEPQTPAPAPKADDGLKVVPKQKRPIEEDNPYTKPK